MLHPYQSLFSCVMGTLGGSNFVLEVILGKGFMVYASVDALGKDALGTDL